MPGAIVPLHLGLLRTGRGRIGEVGIRSQGSCFRKTSQWEWARADCLTEEEDFGSSHGTPYCLGLFRPQEGISLLRIQMVTVEIWDKFPRSLIYYESDGWQVSWTFH